MVGLVLTMLGFEASVDRPLERPPRNGLIVYKRVASIVSNFSFFFFFSGAEVVAL